MQKEQPDNIQSSALTQTLPSSHKLSLQTQSQKLLLKKFQDSKSNCSIYHAEIALQDLHLKSVYVLQRNLLSNSRITPIIRARIRGFIMDECVKQMMTRDTGSLACTYVDLYFQKKGFCQVQDLQALAISCLMLARKHQEGKVPTISFKVFSKESILRWEAKVAKKLQYFLFPPTHIIFGEHLVRRWQFFILNQAQFIKKFTQAQTGANLILRSFYEQLDCLLLVIQTFSWQLQNVVLNMFYLHAYLLNTPHVLKPHGLCDKQFVQTFYSEKNEFKLFFQKFLFNYSQTKKFSLDFKLGLYLKMFLGLNVSKKEFVVLNKQPKYRDLRVWDKFQTFNSQAYELAKRIMQEIKNR